MKTFFKVLAVLAVLAGIAIAIATYLESKEASEYISLYGDDEGESENEE